MRETIYQSPNGEGPSVVREMTCVGCHYLGASPTGSTCEHIGRFGKAFVIGFSTTTPSWCPIVQANPEEWEWRLKGDGRERESMDD